MTKHCDQIRDQIRELEEKAEWLQTLGLTSLGLVFLVKQVQAEIAEREAELKECDPQESPALSDPKVFGSEVTQGLPEYELVAGKDTLARVFVGAKQPVVLPLAESESTDEYGSPSAESQFGGLSFPDGSHFDVPVHGSSQLDFATLTISGPGGLNFEVPGQMSEHFTNTAKSLSEEDNVNFYIDGDQVARVGSYRLVARFYRDGILVGTNDLGTHRFNDTKDLRLLITVDTFPMSVEAWSTVFDALEFLQRNMPVRAGIAPMDSDLSAGLRFYVDPEPFDPDWPAWGPVKQRFTGFNQEQAANGSPDVADKVMTVRTQQTQEGPLGGTAQMPGDVSGVVLNVNPPGDSYFATIVSQEIGHNFDLGHAQDPQIPAESAFDLLHRKSLSAARNVMYNPVGSNEFCLFSAQDWSTLRKGLLQLNSTGPE
ncbi:hypothetical protein [Salinigranum sp.]|uniref:hypothetical protein n=1 Tax=Salinigranum sp. TaxID=1966351 RepID=UPI0035680730